MKLLRFLLRLMVRFLCTSLDVLCSDSFCNFAIVSYTFVKSRPFPLTVVDLQVTTAVIIVGAVLSTPRMLEVMVKADTGFFQNLNAFACQKFLRPILRAKKLINRETGSSSGDKQAQCHKKVYHSNPLRSDAAFIRSKQFVWWKPFAFSGALVDVGGTSQDFGQACVGRLGKKTKGSPPVGQCHNPTAKPEKSKCQEERFIWWFSFCSFRWRKEICPPSVFHVLFLLVGQTRVPWKTRPGRGPLYQSFPNCVRRKFHALTKSLKFLFHVAVGFRLHNVGVSWPNPEFISVS